MAGNQWYRLGTVACTQGSDTVVGTGTNWASSTIQPGDEFSVDNTVAYEVVVVVDDTHMRVDRGFEAATVSGHAYSVRQNFSPLAQTLLTNITETLAIFRSMQGLTPVIFGQGVPTATALQGAFYCDKLTWTLYAQGDDGEWHAISGGGGGGGGSASNVIQDLGNMGVSREFDATSSRIFKGVLNSAGCAILPTTTGVDSDKFLVVLLELTQDATGGRALSAQAGVTWTGSGYVPGINPAPGSRTVIEYSSFDGGASWVAAIVYQTAGS